MSVLALRPLSTYLRNVKVRNSLQLLHQANWRNLLVFRILQKPILKPIVSQRNFSTSPTHAASFETEEDGVEGEVEEEENQEVDSEEQFIERYLDPKDRSRLIAPEISIKYLGKMIDGWSVRIISVIFLHLESVAFKTTYGKNPVWTKLYL